MTGTMICLSDLLAFPDQKAITGVVHQILSPISNSESTNFFNEYLLWFLFSTGELRKNVCYEPMGSLFLFQLLKLRKIRETNWWNYLIWLFKIQKLVTNCNVQTAHFLRQNRPFYQLKNPKTHQLPHSTLFDCIPNNSQKSTYYIIPFQLLNVSEVFLMGFVQNSTLFSALKTKKKMSSMFSRFFCFILVSKKFYTAAWKFCQNVMLNLI